MPRKPKEDKNYFGSQLENSIQIREEGDIIREVHAAWERGSSYKLFSDLFFKPQSLPVLKICDYLFDAYYDTYGPETLNKLRTHLALFADALQKNEDLASVAEDQVAFLQFIGMYLEAKEQAENRLQHGSEITVGRIVKKVAGAMDRSEIPYYTSAWKEMIRNTAVVAPHSLLALIESMLGYQQRHIIAQIQNDIIAKRNQTLGQDPF